MSKIISFLSISIFAYGFYLIYLALAAAQIKNMDAFAYHMVFAVISGVIAGGLVIMGSMLRKEGL